MDSLHELKRRHGFHVSIFKRFLPQIIQLNPETLLVVCKGSRKGVVSASRAVEVDLATGKL
jgi:hypothetical protein